MSAFCRLVLLFSLVVTSFGCAASMRARVETMSERPPIAASTYRVELSDEQQGDLEVARLASTIHARMSNAGFVRVKDGAEPDLIVRFDFGKDNGVVTQKTSGSGFTASRGTTVSRSRPSVAGVGLPVGSTRNVSHTSSYGVSAGAPTTSQTWSNSYRLELMFEDADGPSHKVSVSVDAAQGDLHEIAPCLVEAAFDDFPRSDGQEAELWIDAADCRAG